MELKLSDRLIKKLQDLPESGMGYQVVNFKLKDGTILKNITVLNSSSVVVDKTLNISNIIDVELVKK